MTISYNASASERRLVDRVAARYVELVKALGYEADMLDTAIDLIVTNANGCPLDFEKLVKFDMLNLIHDVHGIVSHLNRKTGRLDDFFLPRCSK